VLIGRERDRGGTRVARHLPGRVLVSSWNEHPELNVPS